MFSPHPARDSEQRNEVLDVALVENIRRWYIRDRILIRVIARRLDISCNTVRRYIRFNAIGASYPPDAPQAPSIHSRLDYGLGFLLKQPSPESKDGP